MKLSTLQKKIEKNESRLRKAGVRKLSLFGSCARGEQNKKSDVDVLVELYEKVDLFDFIDIKYMLEQITKRPVDLVTPNSLKLHIKDNVLAEARRIF